MWLSWLYTAIKRATYHFPDVLRSEPHTRGGHIPSRQHPFCAPSRVPVVGHAGVILAATDRRCAHRRQRRFDDRLDVAARRAVVRGQLQVGHDDGGHRLALRGLLLGAATTEAVGARQVVLLPYGAAAVVDPVAERRTLLGAVDLVMDEQAAAVALLIVPAGEGLTPCGISEVHRAGDAGTRLLPFVLVDVRDDAHRAVVVPSELRQLRHHRPDLVRAVHVDLPTKEAHHGVHEHEPRCVEIRRPPDDLEAVIVEGHILAELEVSNDAALHVGARGFQRGDDRRVGLVLG